MTASLGSARETVGTYSVEAEAGEERERSAQSLEASHPAWPPVAGPWHRRCPFPGTGVPQQSPLSAAGAPAALSSGLQRCPSGSAAPYVPPEQAGVLGAPVSRTRAVALPLLPSGSRSSWPALPFPNATGPGRGVAAGRAGVTPWLEPLPRDPCPAAGFGPGRLPAQRSGEGLFSAGAGTRAQGAGLPSMSRFLPCSAAGTRAGSWEPGPPLPFPWKLAPALGNAPRPQFPPSGSREGGRERRHPALRSPAEATGRMPGRWALRGELLARQTHPLPSCQSPRALLWGAASTLGLAPLPWQGWHPTPALLSGAGSPGRTSGSTRSHGVREERPAATSCRSPRLSAHTPPPPTVAMAARGEQLGGC